MADTIRDVIIRIGIEQKPFKAVVPDFTAVEQAMRSAEKLKPSATLATNAVESPAIAGMDAVLKKAEEVRTAYQNLFEEIRRGFQSAAQATESANVYRSPVRGGVTRGKGGDVSLPEFEKKLDAALKEAEEFNKWLDDSPKRAEAWAKKQQASFNIVAESTRAAGEGAFRAARGFVLLTSSGSDLQAFLEKLRIVQGGWDVFSGGLSTIQHVAKGFKAMSDAGGVWVFMTTQMTRAQGFLTASLLATRAAAASVASFMGGPVVATAVAAVAIWGVATYAMGGFSKQSKETDRDIGNLVTTAHLLREDLHALEAVKLNFGLDDELANIRKEGRSLEQQLESIDERIGFTQKEVNDLRALDVQKKLKTLDPKDDKDAYDAGLSLLKTQEEFQRRVINLEKEKISIFREQQSELQKNLEKQQQILATAKTQLDQERQRVQSIQESLGRLNEVERLELQRLINKKKAGGTLNEGEMSRYEQLGGQLAKPEVQDFYAKKGAKQAEELSQVTTGKSLAGAGSVLEARNTEFAKQTEILKKQRQESEQKVKELGGLIGASVEHIGALAVRLYEEVLKPTQQTERRLEQLERGLHQGQIGNRMR